MSCFLVQDWLAVPIDAASMIDERLPSHAWICWRIRQPGCRSTLRAAAFFLFFLLFFPRDWKSYTLISIFPSSWLIVIVLFGLAKGAGLVLSTALTRRSFSSSPFDGGCVVISYYESQPSSWS